MMTMTTRQVSKTQLLLGAAAVGGALLLGVLVGRGGTAADTAVDRALGRWCAGRECQTAADALATEGGWPYAVYATVALPLLVAGVLLLGTWRGEVGRHARALARRLLLVFLVLVVAQELLSHLYGRVGPGATASDSATAYPSGAAVLVAFAWIGAGLVIAVPRPEWRGAWWPATFVVLVLHLVVRVAVSKHWTTDIVGSYLLVAGALALTTSGRYRSR
jgi:hypothetical protein